MSEESPTPMEQASPTPVTASEENASATRAGLSDVAMDHIQAVGSSPGATPCSEMSNLPRDFLSLRPQEPALAPPTAQSGAASEQPRDQPSHLLNYETKEEHISTAASVANPPPLKVTPLIAVHMAPSSLSITPVLQKCSNKDANKDTVYPRPLATHEEVLRDKELFLDTLRRLHGSLGFKSLTIPTIGGTQLDLHLLYREVTARGGLQQVIKDRIWKEIKAVFHFPPTTTNASFVLRKYYSSLLHHYEQVYFFRNQGNLVPAPGDTSSAEILSDDSDAIKRKRRRNYDAVDAVVAHATNCIGQTVTGTIEGKFEHGYLVTVTVGTEKLKGVLYNVPPGEYIPQFTTTSKLSNGTQSQSLVGNVDGDLRHKRRRRLGIRKKDPNAPKLNRSAYNFFFAEQRARIRLLQPNKEISRMIGDSWSKLTDEQRMPYKQRGLVDKERYREEIKLYRERIKMQESPSIADTDRIASSRGADTDSELHAAAEDAHEEEDASDDPEQEHEETTGENLYQVSSGPSIGRNLCQAQEQETLEFKSILSNQA